jgi:hypothetical protein
MKLIVLSEASRSLSRVRSRRTPKQCTQHNLRPKLLKTLLDFFPLYADKVLSSVRGASLHTDVLPRQNHESNTQLV